ncbi:hypothetical protein PAMA_017792 [Pampus argenteus]
MTKRYRQVRLEEVTGAPQYLKAAKNTFYLLVSIVEELSLLIGGELGLAHHLRSNILSKMEQKWQLIGSPQSLPPLAARGVAARPGTLLDFKTLDSAPLRRLDWQKSTAEAREECSSLIDSSSSFRAYRVALSEVEPPCIPYLGLILQDLTFVHLGNPDMLMTSQGSKVNFSKCWQQFNILDTLRCYQQVSYPLQPNDDIISFFNDFNDHLAEEALWELSLKLRPRNAPRANLC